MTVNPPLVRNMYGTWLDRFEQLDLCPWPGPKPVASDRAALLVGRQNDAETFRQLVHQHRLVILDGESGVGKTSLLQAKLVPTLRDAGYVVAACRDWTDDTQRADVADTAAFLAGKIREELLSDDDPKVVAMAEIGRAHV